MNSFTKFSRGLLAALIAILQYLPTEVKATETAACDDAAITINVVSLIDVTCFGLNTGAVTVLASGGLPPYTYLWSNGTIGPVNLALSAGVYTVTCTDLLGATASLSVTIDEPDPLVISVLSQVNIDCNHATGSISVGSTGGTGLAVYLWSNGQVGPVVTNISAGVYVVTATDENNCISVKSITVTSDITLPAVNATVNAEINCLNATVTLNGTGSAVGSNIGYLWTTTNGHIVSGATTLNNCVVDQPGTYVLLVTNLLNGCAASDEVTVTANITLPAVNASVSAELNCLNATVTLNGTGSAVGSNISYLWTTVNGHIVSGATTLNNCVVDQPGTYVLLVTNLLNGCAASASVIVNLNVQLPTVQIATPSALGCQNSTVILNAAGSSQGAGMIYLWTTVGGNIVSGANTMNATVNAAGTYTLTITNSINGCTSTGSVVVVGTPSVVVSVQAITHVSCFGGANGSVTVAANAGVAPFAYLWSNGMTSASISGVAAGLYLVTITDAAGCAAVVQVNIGQPALQLQGNATVIGVSAPNLLDGSVSLSVNGGTAPYAYLWSNGMTTANISSLAAGNYSVTITDANGCTTTVPVIVPGFSGCLLSVSLAAQSTACGQSMGSATATVANPSGAVTYLWSNGMTTATISGLAAGIYSVTVQDGNNCQATASAVVSVATDITPPIAIAQNITIAVDSNGAAAITAAMINNGSSDLCGNITLSINVTSFDCDDMGAQPVVLTVTDANGNTATATATVTVVDNTPPDMHCPDNITLTGSNTATYALPSITDNCSSTSGMVPLLITGIPSGSMFPDGSTTVTYALMTPSGIQSCSFNVTVTSSVITVVTITPPGCPGMNDGSATVSVSGGCTGPFTYLWMDANGTQIGTTATATGLAAGIYTVIVADIAGTCSTIQTIFVNDPIAIDIDIMVISNDCADEPGSIDLTVSGGTPPYAYHWFDENGQLFATTEDLDQVPAGDYTVEVTDANGCIVTSGILTVDFLNGTINLSQAEGRVEVFPNPTSTGMAKVEIEMPQESEVSVGVYSLQGNLLKSVLEESFKERSIPLDMSDMPAGSYLLKVLIDGKPITRKIVRL